MKHLKIRLLFFSFIIFLSSRAQQNHFIYIQTENKQPFYIKLDKQLYSSAASGYIILPKLKNGTYDLAIGFPKSEWPEQKMICSIQDKDMGFLLKNFGDKGWGLFNMQTMDIMMSGNKPKVEEKAVETKTDDFSNLLSTVVNDPSIKQIDPVKEPEKIPAENGATSGIETSPNNPILAVSATEAILEVPRSTISRTHLNKSSNGTEMVFIDEIDGQKDTVVIFIPFAEKVIEPSAQASVNETKASADIKDASDKSIQLSSISLSEKSVENTLPPNESPAESVKKKTRRKERKSAENKFLELPNTDADVTAGVKTDEQVATKKIDPQTEQSTQSKKDEATPGQPSPMINSDCKNFATEEDFMKLRKKMVSEDNDDDMIAVAKKSFKTKCFTVDQVKNLSVLFLKDTGKYNFFDMAYPFVSDSHNFVNLQSQLSDSYYISRFQVMIRH